MSLSQAPYIRVHAKIYGLDPRQIPAKFLSEVNQAVASYSTRIVSVGVRASCIELVIDMQMQAGDPFVREAEDLLQRSMRTTTSAGQVWGSDAGSMPASDQVRRPRSGPSTTVPSQDPQSVSHIQLQRADWLQLLKQHLPPPATNAIDNALDR